MQKINRTLEVTLPNKVQKIEIGQNILSGELDKLNVSDYSNFVIFCDSNFVETYPSVLEELNSRLNPVGVIMVDPNEDSKSLVFFERCFGKMY